MWHLYVSIHKVPYTSTEYTWAMRQYLGVLLATHAQNFQSQKKIQNRNKDFPFHFLKSSMFYKIVMIFFT
jgi:hypothetical protein